MSDKFDPKVIIKENEKSLLLDHNYDGIQELDYPLPSWWLWTFLLTIMFSALYCLHYLGGVGPDSNQELKAAMAQIEILKGSQAKASIDDDSIIRAYNSPNDLKFGGATYASKCVACHGDKGQGLVGPNLTDDAWIQGNGSPSDTAKIINEGVADKGMPNWAAVLNQQEIIQVTAYVLSLRGTNPAGAKPPQGQVHPFKELK
ncbi:MAG: cbb3-type cytochrome c oxidase N-terminal domain-containing protein [Bdellovibrionota bacterium]